jgi:16S rRNA processing protein RimM
MAEFLQIGKIINTHGIKGEVRIIPYTHDIRRYDKLKSLFLNIDGDSSRQELIIESVRYVKDFVYIKFKGIDDMNSGKQLKDHYLEIDKKDAIRLPVDSFFIFDLIDMKVYDEQRSFLGILTDVIETGSNDCYSIKPPEGKEFLIPALKSVVLKVDIKNGEMTVRIPYGLLD